VEDLVSTLTYRLYNRYVGTKWIAAKAHMDKQRSDFEKSTLYTWAPYYGNDPINVCAPPPISKATKVYERREYDVTQNFLTAKRIVQEHKIKQQPKLRKRPKIIPSVKNFTKCLFL